MYKKEQKMRGRPREQLRKRERESAFVTICPHEERWGAGVETQKNVRGEIGGCRVPFNETYAPSLSTIYDGA